MYALSILPRAEQDIEDIADYYDEKRPGLGHEFIQALRPSFEFIKKSPRACRIRYEAIRICKVGKRFPY